MWRHTQQVLQQEAYPAIVAPVDAQKSAIPGAIHSKMVENPSGMWPNRHAKFHADR